MKGKTSILIISLTAILAGVSFVDFQEEFKLTDNEYKVIIVKGRVVFEKSGTDMRRGDVYVKGTSLSFQTKESRASVISKNQGRFILTGNTKGKLKILPSATNISTRSGAILNLVDLKNHFDGKYLVLNKIKLQVGKDAFPMSEDYFFYLKYKYKDEIIAKKLPYENDLLIIDKNEIFKIDGEPIPIEEKEMTIYYKGETKTTKISKFTPVFPNENELKEEIKVMIEVMEDDAENKKVAAITAYLNDFYGHPYKPNLEEWLKIEFDLTINNK